MNIGPAVAIAYSMPAAPFAVFFLNIDRRGDRRVATWQALQEFGLDAALVTRVPALDGRGLWRNGTLASMCAGAVTPVALGTVSPTRYVLGLRMTAGAAALLATTHNLLNSLAVSSGIAGTRPSHTICTFVSRPSVALILDDDARLASGTSASEVQQILVTAAAAANAADCATTVPNLRAAAKDGDGMSDPPWGQWDVLYLGYHGGFRGRPADLNRMRAFNVSFTGRAPSDSSVFESARPANVVRPVRRRRDDGHIFGTFAYVVRISSAAKLAQAVFPASMQLDSALAQANREGRVRLLAVERRLIVSVPSRPEDTDIQQLPAASRHRYT